MSKQPQVSSLFLELNSVAYIIPADDEQHIIQSVGDAVQEATRCVELGTLICDCEDLPSIAIGVLEIMTHICQRSHREHINLVGNAFGVYATMLRIPGGFPGYQADADPIRDTLGEIR